MTLLQKLAGITGLTMPVKELLRDVVLAVCACCRSGNSGGYTDAHTFVDEDAYGPTEVVTVGLNQVRYLSTTLGDLYVDRMRITIPTLGTDDIQVMVRAGGVNLLPAPITMDGTNDSGTGTIKLELDDFAPAFLSDPIPDGSRIEVVTSYIAPGGDFVSHRGLRVRLEGRMT